MPRVSYRQERYRIMDNFERFLQQFACKKFLIRERDQVLGALETAAARITSIYGENILGVSLGGSRAMGLGSCQGDVDYYVVISRKGLPQPIEAEKHIEGIVGDILREAHFRPDSAAAEKISLVPYGPHLAGDTFALAVLPFATLLIKGNAASIQQETQNYLAERRNHLIRHKHDKCAYLPPEEFTIETFKRSCESTYDKLLWLSYRKRIVNRFIRSHSELLLSPEIVKCLWADQPFAEDIKNMAEPYFRERRRNFPFPQQVTASLFP